MTLEWGLGFVDLGMRAANLTVSADDQVGMGVLRGVFGKGYDADHERLSGGLQRILRTFNPDLVGGQLIHIRNRADGVVEFAYLHPSLAPVKANMEVPSQPLLQDTATLRSTARRLVRGVLDSLGTKAYLTEKYPKGTRNQEVGFAIGVDGAVMVVLPASVPCLPGDEMAMPAFPHLQGFEQCRQVNFVVQLWECTLPEADFVSLVKGRMMAAVEAGASLSPRGVKPAAPPSSEGERPHHDRLRLTIERHLNALTRILEGHEQTTHESLCPNPRIGDVAAQLVVTYNSPTAYALGELSQRIRAWVKAAGSRR